MKKLIDILLASIIGVVVTVAGMTRFHHHISADEVCFCIDDIIVSDVSHSHCSHHDVPAAPFDSQSEDTCPLHLDLFETHDNHTHIHLSDHHCCDHHCNICSPEIYAPDFVVYELISLPRLPLSLRDGYDSVVSRRGPPALFA